MNNVTLYGNVTNLYILYRGSNLITEGVLTIMVLLGVFIILFIAFKHFDTQSALMATGILLSIISLLLWTLQLISGTTLFLIIFLMFLAFIGRALS